MVKLRQNHPVYVISVAAELIGCHPRTLRIYEEKGFIHPFRTRKNNRLYSPLDLEKIQLICQMTDHGLNLIGVRALLEIAQKFHKDMDEIMDCLDFKARRKIK